MDYETLCSSLGGLFDRELDKERKEKISEALAFLDIEASPAETQSLALTIGILSGIMGVFLVFLASLFLGFSPLWLLFLGFPAILFFYLSRYPLLKAESEKKKALSEMPDAIGHLIMCLRISPNIEIAVSFAASHSRGVFKKKLESILRNVQNGSGSAEAGLEKLGEEFRNWGELARCLRLVEASTLERTEEKRQDTLDKASEALLGGFAARAEKEARALNTPVMAVFTFGVILPLIFVAIIPFMSLMGMSVGAPAIALAYAVALPLMLFILTRFIAKGRPATIPAPELPKQGNNAKYIVMSSIAGVIAASPLFMGDTLGAMEYLPPLWGLGASAGVFLIASTSRERRLRKTIKNLESGFAEELQRLGTLLSEGRPLEDAMASGRGFMKGSAYKIRSLNTSLHRALFDKSFGSLREVYSSQIRGAMEILVSVSEKGPETAAKLALRISGQLGKLKKSQEEIERSLGGVVSSMKIIAVLVAPLVGGMISSMSVVLAGSMAGTSGFGEGAQAIDPRLITLIIGIYTMESAAILVSFGSGLMHGEDKVMRKFSIGIALPCSIFVFTLCAWLANWLFGGIA
jgi:Flp pilus assembly protein TadB